MHEIRRPPGRPLMADACRPWAAVLLACCAIIVAVLGVFVAHQMRVDRFDIAVDAPFIRWFESRQDLGLGLIFPASPVPAGVLSAAIAVSCLVIGRLNGAVLAALAVPAAEGLTEGLLKPLVDRTYLGNVVYPSGHTTAIFTLAATVTVLLLLSPRPTDRRAIRAAAAAVAFVLACLVALALVGLQWHYFTDTVAGAAVGVGTVCGLSLVLDLPAVRRLLDDLGVHLARMVTRRTTRRRRLPASLDQPSLMPRRGG